MAFDAFSKFMIAVQHKIYYVVLSLARFNLYANSYGYLAGPKPKHDNFWKLELAGVAWYWMYFGGMLYAQRSWQMRLGFLLVSHVAASPVHVQVCLLVTIGSSLLADCTIPFRLFHGRPWSVRILRFSSAPYDNGRSLLRGYRIRPRRSPPSSHTSSFPPYAKAQSPKS
jgi:hypothetical protein